MKINQSFSLDTKTDRAIVEFLDSLPVRQKSAEIRNALKAHIASQEDGRVKLIDVYNLLREIKDSGIVSVTPATRGTARRISQIATTERATAEGVDEPDDIAAALAKLGL